MLTVTVNGKKSFEATDVREEYIVREGVAVSDLLIAAEFNLPFSEYVSIFASEPIEVVSVNDGTKTTEYTDYKTLYQITRNITEERDYVSVILRA